MISTQSSTSLNNPVLNEQRHRWARRYAERGWAVFPILPGDDDSQRLRPVDGIGVEDATTKVDQIDDWWNENPHANIAIATGRVSGLVVVEAYPRDGGLASLKEIRDEFGPFPATRRAINCEGVTHEYYRYPPDVTIPTWSDFRRGVEIRSDGVWVPAPPSWDHHGHAYQWVVAPRDGAVHRVQPFPKQLIPEVTAPLVSTQPERHCVLGVPAGERPKV